MRVLLLAILATASVVSAQPAGDCPVPVLFVHGYTGSQTSWEPFTGHPDVAAIWGPRADVFHAVLNATENEERIAGPDGIRDTADDDVLITFTNRSNVLAPGCVYAANWENWWNEDPANPQIEINGGDSPGGLFARESDSNEEAAQKQGYALGRMIAAVLAANPGTDRVALVGHSMGGLAIREYLQRRDAAGTPQWWVDPAAPGGHRVARVLTVGTPHRGSNLFGNPFFDGQSLDGTPDINSAAVRDLRYSYLCIFCDGPGPYLWGGDEDGIAAGYHTDDVDLDGDETSTITGINIDGRDQGYSDAEDGTTDNPAMPLPGDVRYTWLTSDVGTSGDLVVDLKRQWIYDADGPVPSDGVPHRLADSLLTDSFHLGQQEDTDAVIRGLDEPDYPVHAYALAVGPTYAATSTVRAALAPDGPPTTDPDWFRVVGPARVVVIPTPGLAGRIDRYAGTPPPHTTADGDASAEWAAGDTRRALVVGPGLHHVRVTHTGVGPQSWRTPYTVTAEPLPLLVEAAPRESPVVIASGGGGFRWDARLKNRNAIELPVDVWADALGPDGQPTDLLVAPRATTARPSRTTRVTARQWVPRTAAPGVYTYRVFVGTYPDAEHTVTFPFEKTTAPSSLVVADWRAEVGDDVDLATASLTAEPEADGLGTPSPNPFGDRLAIPLALDAPVVATVAVFDVLGRRVATLWDGPLGPGAHRLVWDAADAAPGPYAVRAVLDGDVTVRQVVRVR